jgi:hypothetical protein
VVSQGRRPEASHRAEPQDQAPRSERLVWFADRSATLRDSCNVLRAATGVCEISIGDRGPNVTDSPVKVPQPLCPTKRTRTIGRSMGFRPWSGHLVSPELIRTADQPDMTRRNSEQALGIQAH